MNSYSYSQHSYQKKVTYTIPDRDEDLIQWLFPNVFNKKYNKTTTKTNLEIMEKVKLEAKKINFNNFRQYVKSIGINVFDNQGANFDFSIMNEIDFKDNLFKNTHEHKRIMQVLASLIHFEQRQLAFDFLCFLKKYLEYYNVWSIFYQSFYFVQTNLDSQNEQNNKPIDARATQLTSYVSQVNTEENQEVKPIQSNSHFSNKNNNKLQEKKDDQFASHESQVNADENQKEKSNQFNSDFSNTNDYKLQEKKDDQFASHESQVNADENQKEKSNQSNSEFSNNNYNTLYEKKDDQFVSHVSQVNADENQKEKPNLSNSNISNSNDNKLKEKKDDQFVSHVSQVNADENQKEKSNQSNSEFSNNNYNTLQEKKDDQFVSHVSQVNADENQKEKPNQSNSEFSNNNYNTLQEKKDDQFASHVSQVNADENQKEKSNQSNLEFSNNNYNTLQEKKDDQFASHVSQVNADENQKEKSNQSNSEFSNNNYNTLQEKKDDQFASHVSQVNADENQKEKSNQSNSNLNNQKINKLQEQEGSEFNIQSIKSYSKTDLLDALNEETRIPQNQSRMQYSKYNKSRRGYKNYGYKKFNIPEINPNIEFHNGIVGFIDEYSQGHVKDWETYEVGSEDIENLYTDLEYDHAFIQWIFPNFFKSQFNSDSRRLNVEERNKIIEKKEYTDFYLSNFRMFLRFLGIKYEKNYEFKIIDEDQFKVCVFQNTHNLMRLQRVFASLSVLGQRTLALNFLSFLKRYLGNFRDWKTYFEHFEILKEENNQSNICFEDIKNYYFQQDLLDQWEVTYQILTNELIKENTFPINQNYRSYNGQFGGRPEKQKQHQNIDNKYQNYQFKKDDSTISKQPEKQNQYQNNDNKYQNDQFKKDDSTISKQPEKQNQYLNNDNKYQNDQFKKDDSSISKQLEKQKQNQNNDNKQQNNQFKKDDSSISKQPEKQKQNQNNDNKYQNDQFKKDDSTINNQQFYGQNSTQKNSYSDTKQKSLNFHQLNWKTYKEENEIKQLYDTLNNNQIFIEQIFPNFLDSQYSRITLEERNQIIGSFQLKQYYVNNFEMFLRFLGISVDLNRQWPFEVIDPTQFYCCLENQEFQIWMRRMIASLSVLGQRKLALKFLEFLKQNLENLGRKEIYKYQDFEILNGEQIGKPSRIYFSDNAKYYFHQELLNKWKVKIEILTDKSIKQKDILNFWSSEEKQTNKVISQWKDQISQIEKLKAVQNQK